MGNSEVGHLTIGSGRILFQDLMRVNQAVRDGSLATNEALVAAFERARARGGNVHLLGLVSHGGVHSHVDHLLALLELARSQGMEERTWMHAFTDGRDVSPTSAIADLALLPAERIATVVGRYYAMDRDQRWDRTEKAVAAITEGRGTPTSPAEIATEVQRSYDAGVTDEFLEPIVVDGRAAPRQGRRGDLLQLPARPRAPALAAPRRARLRPDDDDALLRGARRAGRVRRAEGRPARSRRCSRPRAPASSTSPRRRSTRT